MRVLQIIACMRLQFQHSHFGGKKQVINIIKYWNARYYLGPTVKVVESASSLVKNWAM